MCQHEKGETVMTNLEKYNQAYYEAFAAVDTLDIYARNEWAIPAELTQTAKERLDKLNELAHVVRRSN